MTRVSLTSRTAHEADFSDIVEVVLLQFEHPSLAEPVRLSTDPTERLSSDPPIYGTRSTWLGADRETEPFLFVLAEAEVPSDLEDAPAAGTLVLSNVDNDIARLLRSFTDPAKVHMAVVHARTPDLLEAEFRDLELVGSEGSADEVVLSISRRFIEEEAVPMDRFTPERFPGLAV